MEAITKSQSLNPHLDDATCLKHWDDIAVKEVLFRFVIQGPGLARCHVERDTISLDILASSHFELVTARIHSL